ncbi:MAG: hypothetical protein Q8P35_00545 [Candidatus Yanofskybacteria bacterium]|nr:hypothetical protein [Candidatus Yanofskybacteria bacterium]
MTPHKARVARSRLPKNPLELLEKITELASRSHVGKQAIQLYSETPFYAAQEHIRNLELTRRLELLDNLESTGTAFLGFCELVDFCCLGSDHLPWEKGAQPEKKAEILHFQQLPSDAQLQDALDMLRLQKRMRA